MRGRPYGGADDPSGSIIWPRGKRDSEIGAELGAGHPAWNHDIAPDGPLLVLLTIPLREASALDLITAFPTLVKRVAGKASS